jgi:SAM-dependent methyltransferase
MKRKSLEDLVISDFGNEWNRFKYLKDIDKSRFSNQADLYFLPIKDFLEKNVGRLVIADFGAGSGRWSEFLLPFSSKMFVVEPSKGAFYGLKSRFIDNKKVNIQNKKIENCEIEVESLDLAVSLGVIHHLVDPISALRKIYSVLKPNGKFLCYMYYNMENKSATYRVIWRVADLVRLLISRLPRKTKFLICDLIALIVYLPISRLSRLLAVVGIKTDSIPLHQYAQFSLEVLRNDSLDRFGTRVEKRFSKSEIRLMLTEVGFKEDSIIFSNEEPYWTFSAQKK